MASINPGPASSVRNNSEAVLYDPSTGILFAGGTTLNLGGAGVGGIITYTAPTGTVDPILTGFQSGLATAGTRLVKITLSGNTNFIGLPAGTVGQMLYLAVIAGAFNLSLVPFGATSQAVIFASGTVPITAGDCIGLQYDSVLGWMLQV